MVPSYQYQKLAAGRSTIGWWRQPASGKAFTIAGARQQCLARPPGPARDREDITDKLTLTMHDLVRQAVSKPGRKSSGRKALPVEGGLDWTKFTPHYS
jgi:hypothetical protein